MKEKICIFAGTTEGHLLAERLCGIYDLTLCVATEYGEILLEGLPDIRVHAGRMKEDEMEAFLREGSFARVVDATHPYAALVTENIRAAAEKAGLPLLRVLREKEAAEGPLLRVGSMKEAAALLAEREGNILLTTGSKDLPDFVLPDMSRVWARVLPLASSLEACEKAGIETAHIFAAQGPFSRAVNKALLEMSGARYLVTKDSGRIGGFAEKIEAASEMGITPVVIGRPAEEKGVSLGEALALLGGEAEKPHLCIIGIGPGSRSLLSAQAEEALLSCDCLIGAPSVVKDYAAGRPVYPEYLPEKVRTVLENHPEIRRACLLMRGDTGFFSGAKKLCACLSDCSVEIIPGLSSLSVFAARLQTSWDDAAFLSLHGRDGALIHTVKTHAKSFILTGGTNSVPIVLDRLCAFGLGELSVAVGEDLSLPTEKITRGTAQTLKDGAYAPLSILYIENPAPGRLFPCGIPDEAFIRGDVPMTKSEIRAVSLSKLAPDKDSVIYDIGAGTGSVSVECALASPFGTVYAIEKEADAAELIRQNRLSFGAENICVVEGKAPEAFRDLPAPTHAFIGGSSGGMEEIIAALLEKNPAVRIVINTVTLESLSSALSCSKRFGFGLFDCVSVSAAVSRKVGPYHMETARNPVHIITLQKGADHA